MTARSHSAAAGANFGGLKPASSNAKTASIQAAIIAQVAAICRVKPWTYLLEVLGVTEAVAKHRMAGTREFTADELARLLHSEHGFEFLVAVMADHSPKWWQICAPLMEIADVQRLQIAARRRLRKVMEGALDADRDLTAAIARADSICDPDFVRPHVDALRSMGGVHRGSMAETPKRKG